MKNQNQRYERARRAGVALMTCLLVAACANTRTNGASAAMSTPNSAMGAAGELSVGDRNFAALAAVSGMYEVEVSRLAGTRASNAQIKSYAQMLVQDHILANDELTGLLARRGWAFPATLSADKQAKLERLTAAPAGDFDRQYVLTVGIEDHQNDIRLFEQSAKTLNDEALKAWAAKTLPTLQKHYAEAQKLLGGLNG